MDDTDSNYVPDDFNDDLDDKKGDNQLKQGTWQKFLFFIKHSFRDLKRRPCHFCLAFCSVLIAVLSTLVVNTVVEKGPVIFVTLAQKRVGELDNYYEPSQGRPDDYSNMNAISNLN